MLDRYPSGTHGTLREEARGIIRPARGRSSLLIGSLATVTALAGVGCSVSNNADNSHHGQPTLLTMADTNKANGELGPFAAAVARLSGDKLRIEFKTGWRAGTTDYETGVIRDVQAGKVDLAWAGSRAFDSVGVTSFDALNAPLLIDNYPLEGAVLESSLVPSMLAGLKPLGLVGLGILPGPLRKPLGVWPLVRPQDYRGQRLAYSRSQVAKEAFQALGANGVEIAAGADINGYDGVEAQVASIAGNDYGSVATFLTANVNLWPRPLVLFMNQKVFDSLGRQERSVLTAAARDALSPTLALQQHDQKEEAANLCRAGLNFFTATDADLAALRQAVQPVYTSLDGNALTRADIAQIIALRQPSTGTAAPDAPSCVGVTAEAGFTGQATPIDGVYTYMTTLEELQAISPTEAIPENYGAFVMVLNRGVFTQSQPLGYRAAGIYTVVGDTLTLTFTQGSGGPVRNKPGEQFTYHWTLHGNQLTLTRVPGVVSPGTLRVKPWTRIGGAS